jgi:polyisoprenoid-binding protein YceI
MKYALRLQACAIFLSIALCQSAFADVTWKVAPGRSSVKFAVKHFVMMNVKGKFKSYEGTVITPSRSDFSGAQVQAKIPVGSISTGNSDRDDHLLQSEFFDASQFPDMTFNSTSVTQASDGTYRMKGEITIKDVIRPIEFRVVHTGIKTLPDGTVRSNFKATSSLNRYDFGLRWNQLTETGGVVVDELVKITLNVALIEETARRL